MNSSFYVCFIDVAENSYFWQPVKFNLRPKTGECQPETSNETSCKARCVQNPLCIGIDWNDIKAVCILLYDCNASTHAEFGYRYWEIRRYESTPVTCQGRLAGFLN